MKEIALVTGANKGIGFEVSKVLAQNGMKVLMGARNEKRGNPSLWMPLVYSTAV